VTPAGALVFALILAAVVLVIIELARTRADPLVWAVLLLAIADLVARVALLT
jgi:hypothetical protein